MGVVKNILLGFGIVLSIIISLIVWVGLSSVHFRKVQTPFVTSYVRDLSRHWDVNDVYARSSNDMVEGAATSDGQHALAVFRRLGPLLSTSDMELRSYNTTPSSSTGVFVFKGTFDNGDAVVTVIVIAHGSTVRVQRVELNALHFSKASTPSRI